MEEERQKACMGRRVKPSHSGMKVLLRVGGRVE